MVGKTDDEQVEDIKRWWEKNGKFAIVLLVAVVASVGGGRAWQDYKQAKGESASVVFDQMLESLRSESADKVGEAAGVLIEKHADTQYAVMSALALVRVESEKGEYDSALQRLNWALENADTEALKHVVRIRLARLQVSMGKQDDALQIVAAVQDKQAFAPLYSVVKGDAHYAGGDSVAAIAAYQEALGSTTLAPQLRNLVQMKLDDLGAGDA